MAIFLPTFITPDVRGALGNGVIDADKTWTVSWHVNGASALTAFEVMVYENNDESAFVYSTGKISDGCPFYGTSPTGETRIFSYRMPAIGALNNGNSYRLIITQWWGNNESIVQNSASVFYARSTPTLGIDAIGTNGTVNNKEYTFTGVYTQDQGDTLNWFRWQIARRENLDNVLYDSGTVFGTMDVRTVYDGLFTGESYAVRLTAQTQYGVSADTGWVFFDVDYGTPSPSPDVTAECAAGTNAILVSWTDMADVTTTLLTPVEVGGIVYDGGSQSPEWINYDPDTMDIGGTTSATDAGTYTTTFTPKAGFEWGVNHTGATAWAIYRRDSDGRFVHLTDVPATAGKLYDYGAASRQGPYTYYVFPIQTQTDDSGTETTIILSPPIYSNSVSPCYASWSLIECEAAADGGYRVTTEYLFRYNFSSERMSNNNKPNIETNFTRYPTLQKAPQNYRSGSLSSLIGVVDYTTAKYSDTLSMRDRLFALSTTQNKLFLKSRKGDVIYVGISDAVTAKTADNTAEQTQTISLSWVEVGASGNLLKLTALDNASAQGGGQQSPNLAVDPEFIALNVGESFTATAVWDGGGVLSVDAPNNLAVTVKGNSITVTATAAGNSSVGVSVSPSGVYTGQSAALQVQAIGFQPVRVPSTSSSLVYMGDSQSPVWTNYDTAAMTIGGTTSATNAGSYAATFTLKPGFMWTDGTTGRKTIAWSIGKANPNLTVSPTSVTVAAGQQAVLEIARDGDGEVTVVSSAPSIATASVVDGSTATRVSAPSQRNTLTYSGSTQSPTWNGYNTSIMSLSGTTSGTEPGSYPAIFTLADGYIWDDSPSGWSATVTGVSAGSATITVSVAETDNYLGDSASVPVTVTA